MLILKPKFYFEVHVEAEITPELAEMDTGEIEEFEVYYGKFARKLGELFEVKKEGDGKVVILDGDFSRVKWIGKGMKEGEIIVKGNVGLHCGAYMEGGRIVVEGNADDWLGAEMKGGEIIVKGNAGNRVGCNYWGESEGMKGGRIVVEGDARNYVGERMIDGFIEIKGNAGDFVGTEMKGGTIVVHGNCGYVGWDMKGGEIRIGGNFCLLPPFIKSEDHWLGDINVKGKGIIKRL